ncbi:MAG TPA: PP2C family protein-serine/threonine phosphatase [Vicinamibacterales bacterium]|nr:PP2C family protein-serine/threonine phosphatase [Vicinamibacterales bacterium]
MARVFSPRPATRPQPTSRDVLLHSWPGRLFIASAAIKLLVALWRIAGPLPAAIRVVSATATIGLAIALGVFGWRLFVQVKRHLLWRVRRKLILSYIFIGVIPSLLILVFFLFAGSLVFMNVSAYLFKDGYDEVLDHARLSAQAAATEIAREPSSAAETIERVHRIRMMTYPAMSVAYVAPGGIIKSYGPWRTLALPATVPAWVKAHKEDGIARSFGVPEKDASGEEELVMRAVVKVGPGGVGGVVVVDIPLDDYVNHRLYQQTGVRLENVFNRNVGAANAGANGGSPQRGGSVFFENSLANLDVYDWDTGQFHSDTLVLGYRLRELYKHLSSAQSMMVQGIPLSDALMFMLVAIGILFLIIEAAALVMGLALARSITSSVHELFMGTERVRQGDFTHRINIASSDQLGELAGSFNQMTGSIENLLQTAAEKKRMEEELRIARQIQMSLLPRGPLEFAGIGVTALCVPAREVGGDYYDFFPLGDRRLGVLIADVSGKGTSAALYMAELKGLVLSLSQIYQSPRQLLLEVNRIISENLDTRSFITMTYAVLDLVAGTATFARAGHTPLLYLRGDGSEGGTQVLVPNGLVVGLRIPGATEKFAELLEEHQIDLHKGDVIVLYTDGITEAMNRESDLFGDARLGRLVAEHGHLDTGDLRERILREIESFVGTADQHDDMTMILIKVEQIGVERARVAV